MNEQLQKKVDRAVKLIQEAGKMADKVGQPLEIAYSAGKDSDVILELAKMSGVNYRAIYKNTTIDPPGTISHAIARGAEVKRPKHTFFQLIEKKGWPSRTVRFCCQELKEYKIYDYAVLGVRREESSKREELYQEPEQCRYYGSGKPPKKTKRNAHKFARQYYPLLDWTTDDVADFLKERNVKCAPTYYDEEFIFHPERRLGCICCPLASRKQRIMEFVKYPNMVKAYIRGGKFYLQNHYLHKRFSNIYQWFVCYLFCESFAEFDERFGPNLFNGGVDCKEFLENYFKIKL